MKNKIRAYKMRRYPVPSYGDLFTAKDFWEDCKSGFLTNYDGYGEWSDGKYVYGRHIITPDMLKKMRTFRNTHVVWYNK